MKHVRPTTRRLPRKASDCCNCLDETSDNWDKCVKMGRCEEGHFYVCRDILT